MNIKRCHLFPHGGIQFHAFSSCTLLCKMLFVRLSLFCRLSSGNNMQWNTGKKVQPLPYHQHPPLILCVNTIKRKALLLEQLSYFLYFLLCLVELLFWTYYLQLEIMYILSFVCMCACICYPAEQYWGEILNIIWVNFTGKYVLHYRETKCFIFLDENAL